MMHNYILDSAGHQVDLEAFQPVDEAAFIKSFLSWRINPEPLDEVDREVDTDLFIEDLEDYVRDVLKIRKKVPLALSFRESGNLFRTTYWIFDLNYDEQDFYVMLARDLPMTEILMVEKQLRTPDGVEDLSPFQAAAWDLLNPDSSE